MNENPTGQGDAGISYPAPAAPPPAPVTPAHAVGGIREVVGGLIVALVASIIIQSFWLAAKPDANEHGQTLGLTLCGLAGVWIGFLGAPLLASRLRGTKSLTRDFGLKMVVPRDVVTGVAWGVIGQLAVQVIYLPVRLISPETARQVSARAEATVDVKGWGLLVLAVALVVVAPMLEELFFRGLLQRVVAARLPGLPEILIPAVIFGVFHFAPIQTPALIAFGCLLGVLARRNGRLGENIAAHASFNAITVIALALGKF